MPLDLTLNLGSTFLDNLSMKINEVLLQMAKIDDDLTALKTATDANTAAVTAAVAAIKAGGVTAAQLAAVEAATATVTANNDALNAVVTTGP
jgi:Xaa-Pro aminopeptidase